MTVLALTAAACFTTSAPTGPDFTVDAAGGSFQFAGGNVQLVFPQNAVAQPLLVSVIAEASFPPASGSVPGTEYRFEPNETQFALPVQLTIMYDPDNVPTDVPEGSLKLYRFMNDAWEPVEGGTVDLTNGRVSGPISGFSRYSVIGTVSQASTGSLEVQVATSGDNVDPDGYTVTLDGAQSQSIGVNGSVTFDDLAEGTHSVQLTGLAGNCSVNGSNPRDVDVPAGGAAQSTFAVVCSASTGDLQVTAATTGSDLDPDGYTAVVDGSHSQPIQTNGSVTFDDLAEWTHSVQLAGMAANCAVGGSNPRSVSVPAGGAAQTTFNVTCQAASTGDLQVTVTTTGSDLDPNGYTVVVDGAQSQSIQIDGSVTFESLAEGTHSVQLTGVAGNCSVSDNPRDVSVPADGTANTTFDVTCTASSGSVVVEETFEDTDFASRGWYDLRPTQIVFDDDRGGNVLEMTFQQGDHSPTTGMGRHLFEASEAIYLGFWVRYSANWVGSQTGPHPHEFFFLTDADSPFVGPALAKLQVLIEQSHCVHTSGDVCPTSVTGMIPMIGANQRAMRATEVYFTDAPGPRYKNDWHHIEVELRMNSGVGVPDGLARYWFDGELIIDEDDVIYRAEAEDEGFLFNQFLLGPWMAGPDNGGSPVTQTMWVDDLTIAIIGS